MAGEVVSFLARAQDAELESCSVRFAWGEGDTSGWSEFRSRFDEFTASHAWADSGHFIIKVQARDESGHESEWLGGIRLVVLDSSIVRWVAVVGHAEVSCPAIAPDGTVYVSAGYGIVAVDPDGTGLRQVGPWGNGIGSVAVAEDGTVYAAYWDCLRAFNPDGSVKWVDSVGTYDLHSPAIGPDGTVYACDYDTAVAIEPDGVVKWRTGLDGRIRGSPVVARDGTIVFLTHSTDAVCALDPDGNRKWTAYIGSVKWLSIDADDSYCAVGNGVTWLGVDGAVLRQLGNFPSAEGPAIIRNNGDILVSSYSELLVIHPDRTWEHVTGGWHPGLAAAVDGAGDIYFGNNIETGGGPYYNSVVCLDSSLARKWSIEYAGQIRTAPSVARDGTVYAVTSDGCLYALKGTPLSESAPWPKFGHDSRNTGCAVAH